MCWQERTVSLTVRIREQDAASGEEERPARHGHRCGLKLVHHLTRIHE